MQDKAEIAGILYKAAVVVGPSTTTLAWLNTNSSAITAVCAVITVIVVTVTAITRSRYDRITMEAIVAKKEKPIKEDPKPAPIEPASVPCSPSNPCK